MIVKAKLHGFIVTLAMLIALRGLQTYITGGNSMSQLPYALVWMGGEHILGLSLSTWIFLILTAAAIVVMGYTTVGQIGVRDRRQRGGGQGGRDPGGTGAVLGAGDREPAGRRRRAAVHRQSRHRRPGPGQRADLHGVRHVRYRRGRV